MRPIGADLLRTGITYQEFIRQLAIRGDADSALRRGEAWVAERLDRHRGKSQDMEVQRGSEWYHVRESLLPDGGVIVVISDITRQKELEAELRQSQRLETIGTLAGGIAHDLNNILTPIFGSLEFALEDAAPDSQLETDLKTIRKAAGRTRDTVRQILTFSRREVHDREKARLDEVLGDAMELLDPSLLAGIETHLEIDPACPPVQVNATQLHQVILNLGVNAQHAMKQRGGRLEIKVEGREVLADEAQTQPNLEPGSYACLEIKDQGEGMEEETLERIFEPFFTTKDVGEGTGLGLSTAHGIMIAHGGAIMVESEPAKGSTFTLYLPAAEE
ncbi:MAG: ATP-binding protein [Rhodospirillales bacterium]|nr:ATP-binding protein [Rhodospirillales bacterium]